MAVVDVAEHVNLRAGIGIVGIEIVRAAAYLIAALVGHNPSHSPCIGVNCYNNVQPFVAEVVLSKDDIVDVSIVLVGTDAEDCARLVVGCL